MALKTIQQCMAEQPFRPNAVSYKQLTGGKESTGKVLFAGYIDSRDVQERLTEVFGFEGWQSHLNLGPDGSLTCSLAVFTKNGWITRTDLGANDHKDFIVRTKGTASDALKRAAVLFGIGRFLYQIPNIWAKTKSVGGQSVPVDDAGNEITPNLPDECKPATSATMAALRTAMRGKWKLDTDEGKRHLEDFAQTQGYESAACFRYLDESQAKRLLNQIGAATNGKPAAQSPPPPPPSRQQDPDSYAEQEEVLNPPKGKAAPKGKQQPQKGGRRV